MALVKKFGDSYYYLPSFTVLIVLEVQARLWLSKLGVDTSTGWA